MSNAGTLHRIPTRPWRWLPCLVASQLAVILVWALAGWHWGLRQRGGCQPYLGVDVDAGKIARAQRAAIGLPAVRFDCLDVQAPLPAQAGHVLLLDVLQYLDAGPQQALLREASMRVAPGGRLLLRTPLATGDGRDRTTRVADRLAWLVGWMGTRPRHYPDPQVLQATLAEAGLKVTAPRPLHGRTPVNSWLLVAERPAL